jgi:hypothetical protein
MQAASSALPQGPSLRSGLCCPGPSPLIGPIRPTRRHVAISAWPLIRDAFAVRERLGDPRVVPCFCCSVCPSMPSSTPPEARRLHAPSSFADGTGLARPASRARRTHNSAIRFRRSLISGFPGSLMVQDLRCGLLVRSPSWRIGPGPGPTQPTRTFPSALSMDWSSFPSADMATAATGKAPPVGLSPTRASASIAAR